MLLESVVGALRNDPTIEVVGAFGSAAETRAAASGLEADVIVVDLELGDELGTAIMEPVQAATGAPVLLISGAGDRRGMAAAVESGCAGFVSKGLPLASLVRAIHTVAAGGSVFPTTLLEEVLNRDKSGATPLTEKEMEVLQLLATGRPAAEIAEQLFVSIHTARNHIRSILSKLEARSQLEAVVLAVRSGLVRIDRD